MASEHLKKITNKAKQLRRANPKLKWTDAVKKASKLVRPAAKKAATKKRVVRKVSGVKKSAPKRVPTKKTHKDTKSHNVNIRVVSGVKKPNYKKPASATKLQHMYWLVMREAALKGIIEQIKKEKPLTPAKRKEIVIYQKQLKAVQAQKIIEKKLI